ncbi:MAG TPA: DUF5678 domain-containing protein [Blastocatellia bacterium]|nr:DUF5678 domain-containing protein [Blastocatellia bacterium]HMV81633.1 DUF5678 domain-containing protein [Blastocatellia bacterium]HMX29590.1 DUF5678 domain-containing protein [Blastocatellia bacterium]HMY76952.1 DUF5678 domain-containing protein [Blastocatellia bacterium]HMZ17977.1 DUF5678 domain-containing protein [Blastocatellia bacterium]
MPSVAYEEISQRIPLLTPEEKAQLFRSFFRDGDRIEADVAIVEQNGAQTPPSRLPLRKRFEEEREWLRSYRAQYRGRFVALDGNRLLAYGTDEGLVIDQAREAGISKPFVTYIESEAEEHSLGGWLDE